MALSFLSNTRRTGRTHRPESSKEVARVKIAKIDWTEGKCATGDARLLHLFFSEEPAEIAEAKLICQGCPLAEPCLRGAIERAEPWGVWGGQLLDRGRVLHAKRRRGRPSKVEIERQIQLERELGISVA